MIVAGMLDIPDAVLSLGSNPSRDLILKYNQKIILGQGGPIQVVSFTRK